MSLKIISIAYKNQHHVIELNNIDTLYQLRTKIHKLFKKLPFLYQIINQDQKDIPLNQQDYLELKYNQKNNIRLMIKSTEIQRSEAFDILDQSEFMNQSRVKEQSVIYIDKNDSRIQGNQKIQASKSDILQQKLQQNNKIQESIKIISNKLQNEQIKFLQKKQKKDQQVLNQDIQCDECFSFPIKGSIYKCLVCQNYDICSKCQKTKHQYHPLLKISHKDQYPKDLYVKFTNKSKNIMQSHEKLSLQNDKKIKQQYKKEIFDNKRQKQVILKPQQITIKKVKCDNFLSKMIDSKEQYICPRSFVLDSCS